jgi:hypothetical protein
MLEIDDDGNPATWGDHVSDEEYERRRRSTESTSTGTATTQRTPLGFFFDLD